MSLYFSLKKLRRIYTSFVKTPVLLIIEDKDVSYFLIYDVLLQMRGKYALYTLTYSIYAGLCIVE